MCFTPQRRALFRHLNFWKRSERGVFCTFWLRTVLRATTTCTFSTSQLPKVFRTWCVLYILTWKCALRRNGVQFFISHLPRCLRTRPFNEPTFRPSGATNHRKTQWISTFLPFRAPSSFFSPFLFSDLSSSAVLLSDSSHLWLFHLSMLSEVWLQNFLRSGLSNCHKLSTSFNTSTGWIWPMPQTLLGLHLSAVQFCRGRLPLVPQRTLGQLGVPL